MKDYIQQALRTRTGLKVIVGPHNEDLLHGSIGLSTEANEILTMLKAHLFYGRPLDILNIKEELGDCLWYIAILCNDLGISFEELQRMNIEKLRIRHPEKFDDKPRDLKKERKVFES